MKTCKSCGLTAPAEAFQPKRRYCRPCWLAVRKAQWEAIPVEQRDAMAAKKRNAYRSNRGAIRKQRQAECAQKRDDPAEGAWYAENVLAFDPCSYCGGPAGVRDHIVALYAGGGNEWSNLTAACRRCNSSKRERPLLLFLAA